MSAELTDAYTQMLAMKPETLAGFDEALVPGTTKDAAPVPDDVRDRYEFEERQVAGVPVQILHPSEGGTGMQAVRSLDLAAERFRG